MRFSVITTAHNQIDNLIKIKPYWEHQTFQDFEWIIADDGSDDNTFDWAMDQTVGQHPVNCFRNTSHDGYNVTKCLNMAAIHANGDYLVFVMGDTAPKSDFLEIVDKTISINPEPKSLYCGVRMDTEWEKMEVVSPEWRVRLNPQFPWYSKEPFTLKGDHSYGLMTLNSMVMLRADFLDMKGIPKEYTGYGKMDWYMAAWAYYHNRFLTIIPNALVYHRLHPEHEDSKRNTQVFEKHFNELKAGKR